MKNTDPNSFSEFPPALFDFAQKAGMKLIHVSLVNNPPKERLVTEGMTSVEGGGFWAAVSEIPKIREVIVTENKKMCDIVLVGHRVRPVPPPGEGHLLVPIIFAVLNEGDKE